MGNCKPCKSQKENLNPEELQRRKKEVEARKSLRAQEEADKAMMKKHRKRILKHIHPSKPRLLSEENIQNILNNIFDLYDQDKDGILNKKQFRDMMRGFSQKKTGFQYQFTSEQIDQRFHRLDRNGNGEIDRDQFYQIYKR